VCVTARHQLGFTGANSTERSNGIERPVSGALDVAAMFGRAGEANSMPL